LMEATWVALERCSPRETAAQLLPVDCLAEWTLFAPSVDPSNLSEEDEDRRKIFSFRLFDANTKRGEYYSVMEAHVALELHVATFLIVGPGEFLNVSTFAALQMEKEANQSAVDSLVSKSPRFTFVSLARGLRRRKNAAHSSCSVPYVWAVKKIAHINLPQSYEAPSLVVADDGRLAGFGRAPILLQMLEERNALDAARNLLIGRAMKRLADVSNHAAPVFGLFCSSPNSIRIVQSGCSRWTNAYVLRVDTGFALHHSNGSLTLYQDDVAVLWMAFELAKRTPSGVVSKLVLRVTKATLSYAKMLDCRVLTVERRSHTAKPTMEWHDEIGEELVGILKPVADILLEPTVSHPFAPNHNGSQPSSLSRVATRIDDVGHLGVLYRYGTSSSMRLIDSPATRLALGHSYYVPTECSFVFDRMPTPTLVRIGMIRGEDADDDFIASAPVVHVLWTLPHHICHLRFTPGQSDFQMTVIFLVDSSDGRKYVSNIMRRETTVRRLPQVDPCHSSSMAVW
jgi:hypothetical protein